MKKNPTFIRRPDFAGGGITDDERAAMAEHVKLWTKRAFRTEPIEPDKITSAIHGLYAAAKLKQPRVVIVPSPFVMVMAGGFAAAIWYARKQRPQRIGATDTATYNATAIATAIATANATDIATRTATVTATANATANATDNVTNEKSLREIAIELGGKDLMPLMFACSKKWATSYQGGNMLASWYCYLTAARDILGLRLPQHEAYQYWEAASIHGGFRWMHEEFCMVCDFPEILKTDELNRPHSEVGPSHRWRDGWSIYHWHGVSVPAHWIEDRANLDPNEVIQIENVEQRAAGCAIVGWPKMLKVLKARVIDDSGSPDIGQLIELDLPGLSQAGRFLKAECPRNGTIVEGVPLLSDIDNLPINTALAAQAWRIGDPQSEYVQPPRRT
jgi:hypothetical protein